MAEKVIHDIADEAASKTKESSLIVDESAVTSQFVVEDADSSSKDIEVSSWNTSDDFMKYIESSLSAFPELKDGSKFAMIHAIAYGEKMRDQMFTAVASCDNEFSMDQLKRLDTIENDVTYRLTEIQAVFNLDENLTTGNSINDHIKKASGKASQWTLVVDPFIAAIVRLCINAKVQGGKNIEETYEWLEKEYNLDDREKLQVLYVLIDSGYPIRGSLIDGQDMISQYLG